MNVNNKRMIRLVMAVVGYILVAIFGLFSVSHIGLLVNYIYYLEKKYPLSMKIPDDWQREADLGKLRNKHKESGKSKRQRGNRPSPIILSQKLLSHNQGSKNLLNQKIKGLGRASTESSTSLSRDKSLGESKGKSRFVIPGQFKGHRSFIVEAASLSPPTYQSSEERL